MKTTGYAATSPDSKMVPLEFERRALRDNDVALEILYCGICHSDLHQARNDWGWSVYPLVPGHEIIGRVIETGKNAHKHKVGDIVAIGCLVDSCQKCDQCEKEQEQYCRNGHVQTYNSPDLIDGTNTYGGYSKHIVSREEFVLKVPEGLDISRAAPLLCAGITTYSPLRAWGVGPGTRVGVIGLGGLGHMAVKLASAMGAEVTVITRSESKKESALKIGAHKILISSNEEAMKKAADHFDIIIDTIPYRHNLDSYTPLLDIDGTIVLVGQIGPLGEVDGVPLVLGRRRVAGSLIGGIAETQEMLNFCAKKNILPECEIVRMDQINEIFERLEMGNTAHRFVIDMSSLKAE